PEASIPVFLATREKNMTGGAGNVAANIAALGASVTLVSVTGSGAAADELSAALDQPGLTAVLLQDDARTTTVKVRYVGAGQQMLRVDHEKAEAVTQPQEDRLLAETARLVGRAGAVILSDYGKGVLTPRVIAGV